MEDLYMSNMVYKHNVCTLDVHIAVGKEDITAIR